MALIIIDGVEIPAPIDYQVGIQDISKAERNAKGEIIIERIATKRKIEMSWGILTKEEMEKLLNAVNPVFFNVKYIDPQEGGTKSGTFYCGDRTSTGVAFIKGNMIYKNAKFNIIER